MPERKHIPNIITFLRILLVVPIVWCLAKGWYREALGIVFIAGASDGVDGYLARKYSWRSRFGAIVDPLADKLMLVVIFAVLTYQQLLPLWLFVIVIARDLIIVFGAVGYHYLIGRYKMQPSFWGKLCTFSQIVYVLAVIMYLANLPMPDWVISSGAKVVAAITLISGLNYFVVWGLKAWRKNRMPSL